MQCSVYSSIAKPGVSFPAIKRVVFEVLTQLGKEGEVSLHLIGDTKMKTLNRNFRGKDRTTDVLSFSTLDGGEWFQEVQDYGDIFISIPQIRRQAKQYEVTYRQEFARMLVHGVLHLLGYDHIKKEEEKIMMPLQENLVAQVLEKKLI